MIFNSYSVPINIYAVILHIIELWWTPLDSYLGHMTELIHFLEQCFSNLALLTFWEGYFFVVGDCSMHFRMFSNIPGLCPLMPAAPPLPVVTTKTIFRHCQVSLGSQNFSLIENHWLRVNSLKNNLLPKWYAQFKLFVWFYLCGVLFSVWRM